MVPSNNHSINEFGTTDFMSSFFSPYYYFYVQKKINSQLLESDLQVFDTPGRELPQAHDPEFRTLSLESSYTSGQGLIPCNCLY